jgi:hypothetical protein
MALHAISYDLSKPDRDYDRLFKAIKSLGSWCHPLKSMWVVKTNLTVGQIRDRLKSVVDSDDHLLVTEMTGAWASYNVEAVVTDWLKAA